MNNGMKVTEKFAVIDDDHILLKWGGGGHYKML